MGTRTRLSRSFFSAMLGFGLLSLVFLGSPGCGCGDDNLRTGEGEPERCCCLFTWVAPREAWGDDVRLVFENVDASLDPEATPDLLENFPQAGSMDFTICVNEEHVIGDGFDLVFVDDATNLEYGRAELRYKARCRPGIELEEDQPRQALFSEDCGGGLNECCCQFEWLPVDNQAGDVTIAAQNVTAGLDPVISPTSLTGVSPGEIELIDICVAVDHPVGASMDLVISQTGSGTVIGAVQLVYDERCIPTVVPTSAAPTLEIWSTECGGAPPRCCCEFLWIPPVDYSGNVNITAVNASTGLDVVITPNILNGVIPRTEYRFQVCINANHLLGDFFDLVISDSTGPQLGMQRITYVEPCLPEITDVPGTPGLFLTTTDCGGTAITCCCEFDWLLTDPDLMLPPGNYTATLENIDPSLLPATVTPAQFAITSPPQQSVRFEICVSLTHTLGAAVDLVIRDPTGAIVSTLPMDWVEPCVAASGDPSGVGGWFNYCQAPN